MVRVSPGFMSICVCSGANRHGRPGATLASKRTRIVVRPTLCGAWEAIIGVPSKPVTRQKRL